MVAIAAVTDAEYWYFCICKFNECQINATSITLEGWSAPFNLCDCLMNTHKTRDAHLARPRIWPCCSSTIVVVSLLTPQFLWDKTQSPRGPKKGQCRFHNGREWGEEEDVLQSDSRKNETLIRNSSLSMYRRLSFELLSSLACKPTVSLNSN